MKTNSNSRFIPLQEAADQTGVAYGTFITANRAGRLSLTKDDDDRLYIDVIDLIYYMITTAPKKRRWKVKKCPLTKIVTRPELQPRLAKDGLLLGKLEDHLRAGGMTDPVWVMRDGAEHVLVDGHRRFEAALRTERLKIASIEVKLPFRYAEPISRVGNLRHGTNLSAKDQRAAVLKHLDEDPAMAAALKEGSFTQAALAKVLGISVATVSRALREKKAPEEMETVPTKSVITDLYSLLGSVRGGRLPSDEVAVAVVVLRSAAEALQGNLSANQVREAKAAAANGVGIIAGGLTSQLKKLLDRRGGDRRRNKS